MFKVLLVDDEELALISLRYSFPWNEYGFTEILTATDPQEALCLLIEQHIDAAFVDIRMPGLTGLELIAQARQAQVSTCFVVVSGYSDFSYLKEAIQLDTLDYCLKPVSSEDITSTLEKVSGRVLKNRLTQDPVRFQALSQDISLCGRYLEDLLTGQTDCESLTLLYVRTENLLPLLREADLHSLKRFLFPGPREALLIWDHPVQISELEDAFASLCSSCLMLLDYSRPRADAVIPVLKRLRTECHNRGKDDTGLVQLPAVSMEMADYFPKMLSYLEVHYAEKLTLQDLSRKFGVNYTYLSQIFKKSTGQSFSEYLTRLRLTHACRLLEETEQKISLVAEQTGFSDYHYFCNVFKHAYSMSPLQYRNTVKKRTDIEREKVPDEIL